MNKPSKQNLTRVFVFVTLCVIALGHPRPGFALSPDDYRYGISIDAREAGAFYRFTLTDAVHQRLERPDMRDLFMFDAKGGGVPFTVDVRAKSRKNSTRENIPFFPIHTKDKIRPENFRLDVSTGSSTVRVYSSSGGAQQSGKILSGYLLDLRAFPRAPHTLKFHWKQGAESFAAPLNISTGSDLLRWRAYAGIGTVAEFRQGASVLRQDSVELGARAGGEKYLLISWPDDQRPPDFTSIEGLVSTTLPPALETRLVSADSATSTRGEYLYDLGGVYPLASVNLAFEGGYYPRALLYSRDKASDPWREFARGDFYKVKIKGQQVRNAPLHSGGSERFWRVLISEDFAPAKAPDLEVQRLPVEVRFLAQGEPPFVLAFGGESAIEAEKFAELFSQVSVTEADMSSLALGEIHARVGRVEQEKREEFPWGRWMMWGLLIAAVAMLTGMAWKLVKNLKSGSR